MREISFRDLLEDEEDKCSRKPVLRETFENTHRNSEFNSRRLAEDAHKNISSSVAEAPSNFYSLDLPVCGSAYQRDGLFPSSGCAKSRKMSLNAFATNSELPSPSSQGSASSSQRSPPKGRRAAKLLKKIVPCPPKELLCPPKLLKKIVPCPPKEVGRPSLTLWTVLNSIDSKNIGPYLALERRAEYPDLPGNVSRGAEKTHEKRVRSEAKHRRRKQTFGNVKKKEAEFLKKSLEELFPAPRPDTEINSLLPGPKHLVSTETRRSVMCMHQFVTGNN